MSAPGWACTSTSTSVGVRAAQDQGTAAHRRPHRRRRAHAAGDGQQGAPADELATSTPNSRVGSARSTMAAIRRSRNQKPNRRRHGSLPPRWTAASKIHQLNHAHGAVTGGKLSHGTVEYGLRTGAAAPCRSARDQAAAARSGCQLPTQRTPRPDPGACGRAPAAWEASTWALPPHEREEFKARHLRALAGAGLSRCPGRRNTGVVACPDGTSGASS